jgi:GTP-binding protein
MLKLNSFLGALIGATPPPVRGGKQPKVLLRQRELESHLQSSWSSLAGGLKPHIVRFIERRFREEFKFPGTPVQVAVRVKERDRNELSVISDS